MYHSQRPAPGITLGEPFASGTGGSENFRIPAMVTLADGTLVAACDARWNHTGDGGGLDAAYVYPGLRRVLQAAGRVIRTETDRGVVVFIDERYAEPMYKELLPEQFRRAKFVGDTRSLERVLDSFWEKE